MIWSVNAQQNTISTKIKAVSFSKRDIGPSSANIFFAMIGACGVAFNSGDITLNKNHGIRIKPAMEGTKAYSNQLSGVILTPSALAISTPARFAAIAVTHIPDEMVNPAIESIIK